MVGWGQGRCSVSVAAGLGAEGTGDGGRDVAVTSSVFWRRWGKGARIWGRGNPAEFVALPFGCGVRRGALIYMRRNIEGLGQDRDLDIGARASGQRWT